MSPGPQFSVIIPTYNRVAYLKQALSSVWVQTFTDYEVIVVDDGSDDGTQEYLKELGNKALVIRQLNGGPGAARNAGVRIGRGRYVALLDSDDLWFPWTLSVFAQAIEEHGGPHIVGGAFVEFRQQTELLAIHPQSYQTVWFSDYIASSRQPYFVGSGTCVLRRESLASVSFLEDRLNGEDHDLLLQLGTLPGFVRILSPVTLAWRRHPASETGDFTSTVSGTWRLLSREKSGAYPGGHKRSQERRRILGRYIRSTAVACVRNDAAKQGWDLYRSTFRWNVELGHWKYVLAFPILAIFAFITRTLSAEKGLSGWLPFVRGRIR
jgi:glycosyltransferase involved in cell wall biosynthesis